MSSFAAHAPSRRFVSVDVLRGLTVAFMILVNDPGDWQHLYAPLEHAEWNGWTLTDLVFPSFLFLVGCSIVFAVNGRLRRGIPRSRIALQVLRRALVILLIKLFLSAYPHFHLAHLRLLGVLTRIALCYAVAALFYLLTQRWRWIAFTTVACLVLYWVLLRFVPVPGYGVPTVSVPLLDPDGNLTSYIDRAFNTWTQYWLHTGKLYRGTRDPEGVLSTLPSVATTLFGVLAGMALVREPIKPRTSWTERRSIRFAAAGIASLLLASLWNLTFPINKNLWTSSYVLLAAGFSLLGLAACHFVFDEERLPEQHRSIDWISWPFLVFGSNAIFAYALSSLIPETLDAIHLQRAGGDQSVSRVLYTTVFAPHGSTPNTSLAYAVAFTVICFIPTWLLWRRRWFLRV